MKEKIHPKYDIVKVVCACGASFETKSTKSKIKLDICSSCHPFFTGKQKILDIEGRVEKFQKRFAKTEGKTLKRKPKTQVKAKLERKELKPTKGELSTTIKKDTKDKKATKKAKDKK